MKIVKVLGVLALLLSTVYVSGRGRARVRTKDVPSVGSRVANDLMMERTAPTNTNAVSFSGNRGISQEAQNALEKFLNENNDDGSMPEFDDDSLGNNNYGEDAPYGGIDRGEFIDVGNNREISVDDDTRELDFGHTGASQSLMNRHIITEAQIVQKFSRPEQINVSNWDVDAVNNLNKFTQVVATSRRNGKNKIEAVNSALFSMGVKTVNRLNEVKKDLETCRL